MSKDTALAKINALRAMVIRDSVSPAYVAGVLDEIIDAHSDDIEQIGYQIDQIKDKVSNIQHPVSVENTDAAKLIVCDDDRRPILTVGNDGHIRTSTFDSSNIRANSGTHPVTVEDTDSAKLIVCDDYRRPIVTVGNDGHIRTDSFDSSQSAQGSSMSIKILSIGNSYSSDLLSYLPMILENLIPQINVSIGIAYYGGCSLQQHHEFAINDSSVYEYRYYYTSVGYWQTGSAKKTLREIILTDSYDVITFQQQSSSARDYSSYQPFLNNLIDYVLGIVNYPTKLGWILTPSYGTGYGALNGDTSDSMYNKIAQAAQYVYRDTPIDFILPLGTAIQNARHTALDSIGVFGHLSNEGLHLQEGIPPLLSGYTAALTLFDAIGKLKGVLKDNTRPTQDWIERYRIIEQNGNSMGVNEANCLLAQKCAVFANKNKYNISTII